MKLDEPGLPGRKHREFFQRTVNVENIRMNWADKNRRAIQFDSLPGPLDRLSRSRIVHQHLAHNRGSHGKEVIPVIPFPLFGANQAQVGFIYQGCGLQRVVRAFSAHIPGCDSPELGIDGTHHHASRVGISLGESPQEHG